MSLRVVWAKLRGIMTAARVDRDLDEEIELHLTIIKDRFIAQGMAPETAETEARRQFGNRLQLIEDRAEQRTVMRIETAWQDIRFSFRVLGRNPAFAAAAIATVALGLGINTAIFSIVKTVLLSPLPYREPDRLVMISEDASNAWENSEVDFTTAETWKSRASLFQDISAYRHINTVVPDGAEAEMIVGLAVTQDFFDTLGVRMQLGRNFVAAEDTPGPRRTVILTHRLWERRFATDPNVIGRTLRSEDGPLTVVGVLPRSFEALIKGTTEIEPEMYLSLNDDRAAACLTCQAVRVVGRLKPGVPHAQAQAQLNGILDDLTRPHPEAHRTGSRAGLIPVRARVFGRFETALWVVTAAALFVLLIACANVANLLLARGTARRGEIALRAALGASRLRLARQFITEALLLTGIGGVLSVALAFAGTRALVYVAPPQIPRLHQATLDSGCLLFGLTLTIAAGVLIGVWTAWRSSNVEMRGAGRSTTRGRSRDVLVVAELAMAFVLTLCAGLMLRTAFNLFQVDPGFDPSHVLTLTTTLWGPHYENAPDARRHFYERSLEHIRAIPGVQDAAITTIVPMDHSSVRPIQVDNAQNGSDADTVAGTFAVSPGFFNTMRIPIRLGRAFGEQDNTTAARVAIINDRCVRALFQNTNPIGQHIHVGAQRSASPWLTIVGVVGDVRQYGLDRGSDNQIYVPFFQTDGWGGRLVARTTGDPMRFEPLIRRAFAASDSTAPIFHVKPLEAYVEGRLAERSFTLLLLTLFGGLALLLAAVGVYGVVSYSTSQRTREAGIRTALGASRLSLVLLIMRGGLVTTATGLIVGYVIARGLTRLFEGLLFGVAPGDLATTVLATVILVVTALSAVFLPAYRVARIDPIAALRHD
ncbi:MAG: ABC transporter permease [Bryobacteraceae bacterium]